MKTVLFISLFSLTLFSSELKNHLKYKTLNCDERKDMISHFHYQRSFDTNKAFTYSGYKSTISIKFKNNTSQTLRAYNGLSYVSVSPNGGKGETYSYNNLKELIGDCDEYIIKKRYFILDYGNQKKEEIVKNYFEIFDKE